MGKILTLDVAFANLGWAIMKPHGAGWYCTDAYVIETKRSDKKKKIRVADDDVRRCTEHFAMLSAIIERCEIKGIIAEMPPGGSKSATSAKAMGMAKAVVACVAQAHKLPTEWITPDEGKVAATGKKNASKIQVQRAVVKKYPECTKSFKFKRGSKTEYEGRFEHVADAIAAFMAAEQGTMIRLLH